MWLVGNPLNKKDIPNAAKINSLISHYCRQIEESIFIAPSLEEKLLLRLEWLYAAAGACSRYLGCAYIPFDLEQAVTEKVIFDANDLQTVNLYDRLERELGRLKIAVISYIGFDHPASHAMEKAINSLQRDFLWLDRYSIKLNPNNSKNFLAPTIA